MLHKLKNAYAIPRPIWKSKDYSFKTSIKLFTNNFDPVLMYGSAGWRRMKTEMGKVDTFQHVISAEYTTSTDEIRSSTRI